MTAPDAITEALNHLEAVARAADFGAWNVASFSDRVEVQSRTRTVCVITDTSTHDLYIARHIVNFDPRRALQLIEVVRAARELEGTHGLPWVGARLHAALEKIGATHGE